MFTHRFLGPPRGEHCNSLEENVGRKVVPTFKNRFLREIITSSPLFYRKWIWVMLFQGKRKFLFKQL